MALAVNLAEKLASIDEYYSPRIVGCYNENKLVVVKIKGDSSGTRIRTRTTSSSC